MKRGLLAAIVLLAAAGWLLALLGESRAPAPPVPEAAPRPAPLPAASQPVPRAPRPEGAAAAAVPANRAESPPGTPSPTEPRPLVPLDLDPEERRKRLIELTRQQRELNAARIAVADARWEKETRDPVWAAPHESALQQALVRDGIDSMLMDVECRRTLCRVELAAIDSNAAFALKRGAQFAEALGSQIATRMQGGGLDRVMLLYSARDGTSLDE